MHPTAQTQHAQIVHTRLNSHTIDLDAQIAI